MPRRRPYRRRYVAPTRSALRTAARGRTNALRASLARVRRMQRSRRRRRLFRLPRAGFPRQRMAKLRYVARINLNPGAGNSVAHAVYRGNDLYDPSYALGGHQPMGFDELTEIYQKYRVVGSKFRVSALPSSSNAGGYNQHLFGVVMTRSPDLPAQGGYFESLIEDPRRFPYKYTGHTTQLRPNTVSCGYSPLKTWGRVKAMDEDQQRFFKPADGSGAVDDDSSVYFHLIAVSATAGVTVDPGPCTYLIQVDYLIHCTERKEIDRS